MEHSHKNLIPRIHLPSREKFENEFSNLSQPVIISGLLENWNAIKLWNLDYLLNAIGNKNITYSSSNTFIHPDYTKLPYDPSLKNKNSSFKEYIEILSLQEKKEASHVFYSDSMFVKKDNIYNPILKCLTKDFHVPECIATENLDMIGFWLSAQGVVSWLHYDANEMHNLNAQVVGKKYAKLFAPEEAKNVYMFSGTHKDPYHASQINIVDPDFEKFPNYKNAKCFEGVLETGDMLLIPAFWLHSFTHLGKININVNFFYKPAFLSLNPLSVRAFFLKVIQNEVLEKNNQKEDFHPYLKHLEDRCF